MDDRSAGLAICLVSTALFAYYTVWVLVTPFVEPGHAVRDCLGPLLLIVSRDSCIAIKVATG
jgi:dolichyl-phosphate mannosyltransferase polypeptide 2 regulatory subunit